MRISLKSLDQQTVVITGASSGIGLATARAAAAKGANLVLASRNDDALGGIVQELNAAGATAIHLAADVGQRADVERIAEAAIERFGGFNTWVNNAGVSIFGRLEEVSDEDHRRLFETNFWGLVYGSLVAVKHLKAKGGALINIGSVLSETSIPLQGMYSASKHAVKGFTDALRMELQDEAAPVAVTLIKPTSIDTPYPQHARNYMAQEPKLPPPVYAPEEVARAILHAAAHPVRELYVGGTARVMSTMSRMAPAMSARLSRPMMIRQQRRNEPAREPEGALHQPGVGGRVQGDHPGYVMRRSFYTRSAMHPAITGAVMAAAGVAAAAWMRSRRNSEMVSMPHRHWD